MCIVNRLSGKKRKALLAKKPKVFAVWKAISDNGYSEYAQSDSPNLLRKKIHIARYERSQKNSINYKPGFHCFASRKAAKTYNLGLKIQIFYIRKSWVTQIGLNCDYRGNRRVYVSKKITCDRSLLK